MTEQVAQRSIRKDLRDLYKLPRSPLLSYVRKEALPAASRKTTEKLQPSRFPNLSAFLRSNVWKWIAGYICHRIGRRHRFQTYTTETPGNGIYELRGEGDEIRIALAGDWATGTDEADNVAKLIKAFQPHYSIHLGDVYYVGDSEEVDENFLGIPTPTNEYQPCLWPSGSRGTFALNGNHEMYSLGYGYFDRMLPTLGVKVNGRAQGQAASFFCLENEYWRIIALDTGYNSISIPILELIFQPDCALPQELLTWLRDVVQHRDDDNRGIIFLSHHQYFSRFDCSYPKPGIQLADFFSRPVLWFWGHEHRMVIYKEFGFPGGIKAFGRCIGHGGVPVDLPPAQPQLSDCGIEFIDDRQYPNRENLEIGYNGFAKMTLKADQLEVHYLDVHGERVFFETWTVDRGNVIRKAVS